VRKVTTLGLIVSVLGVAASTAGATATIDAPTPRKLTFYHWWTSPSESAALAALVQLFNKKYPDVKVSPIVLGDTVRPLFAAIKREAADNQSPDAFQANGGYAAQVFFDAGLLAPIDDIWTHDKLNESIPTIICEMSRIGSHYYSVPINVHRANVVWYNKPLLDKYKIDPSTLTTWDAFFAATQTLKAAGVRSPVQMGKTWAVNLVFEDVIASLGIGAYEDWSNGKITAPDDPRLLKAFSILGRYLAVVNEDHTETSWDDAIHRVMKGEGAFSAMGDWANGEFRVAGMKYGKDYGAFLVPETTGLYGLTVDAFQHPRGIADPTASNRWLSLAASREGQDAFNPLKGSIPARTDADVSRYDAYQRSSMEDLKSARHMYPTRTIAAPQAFNTQLDTILVAFMRDGDVKKAAPHGRHGQAAQAGRGVQADVVAAVRMMKRT
jgi:glucose/mannose transport system substrate-binding protein